VKDESMVKPNKFSINEINKGKCIAVFSENIVEQEVSRLDSEEKAIKYVYDTYKVKINNRTNLSEEIENNYEEWLKFAKQEEYNRLAKEVREKRNKLLKETDYEMCLDRMGLEIPEEINAVNLLIVVTNVFKGIGNMLNNKMAKYRQELRDITKQEGFPYDVKFPKKPDKE